MKGSYLGVGRRVAALLLALLVVAGGVLTGTLVCVPKVVAEGANLVQNSYFDTNADSWTLGNGSKSVESSYTVQEEGVDYTYLLMAEVGNGITTATEGKCLKVASNGTQGYVTQSVSVTSGEWYIFRFLHRNGVGSTGTQGEVKLGSSFLGYEYRYWTYAELNSARFALHWYRFKATSATVYITLAAYNGTNTYHTFFDSVELVATPEEVTNNGFETDISGWNTYCASTSREVGGQSGYCMKVTGTPNTPGHVRTGDLGVTSGKYYTLDCYVKRGNVNVIVGLSTALVYDYPLYDILAEEFSSTSWYRVRFNFRAPSSSLYVSFEMNGYGSDKYFYVDEVFLYESRDEVQAAYNTRAGTFFSYFNSSTNRDRWYTRWITDTYQGEGWPRATAQIALLYSLKHMYTDEASATNVVTEALNSLYDTRDGSSKEQWGERWLSGVIAEEAGFGVHWMWNHFTSTQKNNYKTMLTSEAITYTIGPVAYARDYPYPSLDTGKSWANVYQKCGGLTGTMYADLAAYYYDPMYREACDIPYNSDTKAESALTYGLLLAQCAEYWPNDAYATAWKRYAKMIHALAISWDQDYTDDNGHQWNDYRNVATSDLALGNHGWYPNPAYAAAVLKTMNTTRSIVALFDRAIPSEYTEDISGRTSSTFFQTNWNDDDHIVWWNRFEQDGVTKLTSYFCGTCGDPGYTYDCCDHDPYANEPNKAENMGALFFKYVPMFCMYWHYLDGDDHAQFLAYKAVDTLQTLTSTAADYVWWPNDVCVDVNDSNKNLAVEKNKSISSWLENFSQYAARRWVLRAKALGTLNQNDVFPTTLS